MFDFVVLVTKPARGAVCVREREREPLSKRTDSIRENTRTYTYPPVRANIYKRTSRIYVGIVSGFRSINIVCILEKW